MSRIDQQIAEKVDWYTEYSKIDYIGLWQIYGWVTYALKPETKAAYRALTLRVIRGLIVAGFQAGNLCRDQPGFHPWGRQDPDYVVDRIAREWEALGHDPSVSDIAWFDKP